MNIYIFIGTTAEFIKMSPVIKQLKSQHVKFKLITSGQVIINYHEFKQYLGEVKADIAFKYKNQKSSVISFLFWAGRTLFTSLISLNKEFRRIDRRQTFFLVHGDTVSSLLGTLIAKVYGLRLVHIESGLRSYNFFEPFPEEICRYLISTMADIHFCPNSWSCNNLDLNQGVKINTFQNTLLESYRYFAKKDFSESQQLAKRYLVLVVHRQEHMLFGRDKVIDVIKFILSNKGKMSCVLIMHPLTLKLLSSAGITDQILTSKKVYPVPRLPYAEFVKLMSNSEYIITDGGSNQEEAYYLGKPCLILRKHTERTEGLGENALLSLLDKNLILKFMSNYKSFRRPAVRSRIIPSKIIVDYLQQLR